MVSLQIILIGGGNQPLIMEQHGKPIGLYIIKEECRINAYWLINLFKQWVYVSTVAG